jgi:hypothetical protein
MRGTSTSVDDQLGNEWRPDWFLCERCVWLMVAVDSQLDPASFLLGAGGNLPNTGWTETLATNVDQHRDVGVPIDPNRCSCLCHVEVQLLIAAGCY